MSTSTRTLRATKRADNKPIVLPSIETTFPPSWITDTVNGIRDCVERDECPYTYLDARIAEAIKQTNTKGQTT